MSVAAFIVIAFLLTGYVLLDGYDVGVAAISPIVARTDRQREGAMHAIGPFWNGNEVWLIAAAGTLFALFPKAYASSISGFYLAIVVVLWLLMFRGIAMELRAHFPSEIWHQFWDACFFGASVLLIFLYGIAIGNLLHGVPLGPDGYFTGSFAELLNPYALVVGVFALFALSLHGATFLVWRTEGVATERARALVPWLWPFTLAFYIAVSAATISERGIGLSWIDLIPIVSLASLVGMLLTSLMKRELWAFGLSSLWLASLLVQAAATLYPYLLPNLPPNHGGISIFDAAPSPAALASALIVLIAGIVAVLIYGTLVLGRMTGKQPIED